MKNFINIYTDEDKVTLISKGTNPRWFRVENPNSIIECIIDDEFISVVSFFKWRIKEIEKQKNPMYQKQLWLHLVEKYSIIIAQQTWINYNTVRKRMIIERGLIIRRNSRFINPNLVFLLRLIDEALVKHIKETYSHLNIHLWFLENNKNKK